MTTIYPPTVSELIRAAAAQMAEHRHYSPTVADVTWAINHAVVHHDLAWKQRNDLADEALQAVEEGLGHDGWPEFRTVAAFVVELQRIARRIETTGSAR